jgi:hypothetical protein
MVNETQNERESISRRKSLVRVLDKIPSLGELDSMYPFNNEHGDAYRFMKDIERGYEFLGTQGEDVSSQIRERRLQILKYLAEELGTLTNAVIKDVEEPNVECNYGLDSNLTIPTAITAVKKIREYIQKLDPNAELLRYSADDFEEENDRT